ncbi:myelin basic protein b isoform X5 [Gymnodraco acuticeps]|uniref:Myelin basic protein b isoform X5 n=2 Tax=Notothenioidei TaxID=8205 RepID=A0A6P8V731_GYMAC|nr:PREDICTED: myelin basic protein-like isoform X5 [Notothenia coriiceps]XP_033983274.1 myelin basic protein-like isoform X4 [Trematomus bernacchii]XP_034085696.1 myelin basic protein b isoform X5 [Gymnodraco acuticeps]
MASASQKKKAPGLMDQIGTFFGGDKKRKSKGSFRGALSPAPQKAAAAPRKRGPENAVVSFFRTIGDQKSQSAKAKKASAGDGKGTLTRIFKMGSRSASPVKR